MKDFPADFLPAIAHYYLSVHPQPLDRLVFITPNKRTSMFLKRAFCDGITNRPLMLPRFATLANFMASLSDKAVASDDEQLFILYNAYNEVLHERSEDSLRYEFDSFVFWGSMLLNDFNEVDRSLVNAHALFKNLKDIKEIQADYLDEDQRAVIHKIWGDTMAKGDGSLWKHNGKDAEDMERKFFALWELLGDIYDSFNRMMNLRGLTYPGAQEREVLNKLKGTPVDELARGKHFVFVGHNELSKAEALIMERLKAAGAATFFWDTSVFALFSGSLTGTQPEPVKILRGMADEFPMPIDFELPQPETFARLDVLGLPSNIGQAKQAGHILDSWVREGLISDKKGEGVDPIRTAVILPDPDLLIPTLYSIPANIRPVNVAMGVPYRATTFANFFNSLISMHLRARFFRETTHFFYEDVQAVIMHPHVRLFNSEQSDQINSYIIDNKLFNVPARNLVELFPEMAPLFTPIKELKNAQDVADYLMTLFDWVEQGLADEKERRLKGSDEKDKQRRIAGFEEKTVAYFRSTLERLMTLINRYEIKMEQHTFLHLFERVFAQRGIVASGQPLEGLQVLGVLETRAIDFDNVIIMSMNERIYPRKQYTKTMIPNILRRGYGLPEFDSAELTYAYCFYRMLVRSKRVTVLYDARTDGLGGGELSRYVTQVRYLVPGVDKHITSLAYSTATHTENSFEIKKDAKVMKILERMTSKSTESASDSGSRPSFSASAFKTYLKCPLSFYLQYALGFRQPDELVDYKSAADYGTMFHNVIQRLFATVPGGIINAEALSRIKDDVELIRRFVIQEIEALNRHDRTLDKDSINTDEVELSAEDSLYVSSIVTNVRNMLDVETTTVGDGSFRFLASEWHFEPYRVINWKIGKNTIRFKMSIDRVDRIDNDTLRIIDFKTGSDAIEAKKEFAEIFSGDHSKHAIFQIFLYSQALLDNKSNAKSLGPFTHIQPKISSTKIMATAQAWDDIKFGNETISDYSQVQKEFKTHLEQLVDEIFDDSVPFSQTSDDKNCTYCPFAALCGRYPSKDSY